MPDKEPHPTAETVKVLTPGDEKVVPHMVTAPYRLDCGL